MSKVRINIPLLEILSLSPGDVSLLVFGLLLTINTKKKGKGRYK